MHDSSAFWNWSNRCDPAPRPRTKAPQPTRPPAPALHGGLQRPRPLNPRPAPPAINAQPCRTSDCKRCAVPRCPPEPSPAEPQGRAPPSRALHHAPPAAPPPRPSGPPLWPPRCYPWSTPPSNPRWRPAVPDVPLGPAAVPRRRASGELPSARRLFVWRFFVDSVRFGLVVVLSRPAASQLSTSSSAYSHFWPPYTAPPV